MIIEREYKFKVDSNLFKSLDLLVDKHKSIHQRYVSISDEHISKFSVSADSKSVLPGSKYQLHIEILNEKDRKRSNISFKEYYSLFPNTCSINISEEDYKFLSGDIVNGTLKNFRIRKVNHTETFITIKKKTDDKRNKIEIEYKLPFKFGYQLIEWTDGKMILKEREYITIQYGKSTLLAEVDTFFKNSDKEFIIAEIEVPEGVELDRKLLPEWFLEETFISNKELAYDYPEYKQW